MIQYDPLTEAVYPVNGTRLSLADLLRRFSEEQYQFEGVWRLSDLHLKVGRPASYRLDNELTPLEGADPLTAVQVEHMVRAMLSTAQYDRLQADPAVDVDAGFVYEDLGVTFRVNVFRDRDGLACAIRALPSTIPEIGDVGFPTDETWREIVGMRQGLVIVTGVTGSGKSTTVASLLQHIKRNRNARIVTLEDPIEYSLPSERGLVSQRELGTHISSFHQGLRSALREDPDVIFVGEMRDRETTSLALTAAETGHLVLSTLHTRDTRGTITRIVDMYTEDRVREIATQLSFSLSFVIAQKLLPRAGGTGRRVAMEVLKNIAPVGNLIRSLRWHQIYSTIESHRSSGLITLERHLIELVAAGEILPEDARRYANDPHLIQG